ncbi:MAG: flagellar basal body P-ring protein FlgI [Phycisphaeraceae bacterium]|nr:flagellar basal body P-ring protein FlgI [Phycisphaeraceae bacterium]
MPILFASPAFALKIEDVVRLKGSEGGTITGVGLVVGLNGTGDGGKYAPAMKALKQMLANMQDATVTADELKDAKNVAVVYVSCRLPDTGVREGDRLDVHLATAGACKSLRGGRLVFTPLFTPNKNAQRLFAVAEGAVVIEDDAIPTTAKVDGGAQMVADNFTQLMDNAGRLTLVLDDSIASWSAAKNISDEINSIFTLDGSEPVARALDQKNVIVLVPGHSRQDPAAFVSSILNHYIHPSSVANAAKVVINQRTGTIVIGGDVEISPTLISHQGLTITLLTPAPEPTAFNPQVTEQNFVPLDPSKRGGARLADLEAAFNLLKVEAQDRIEILKAMHEAGYLHAQLILE